MPTTRVDTARTPRRKRKNAGATLRNNTNLKQRIARTAAAEGTITSPQASRIFARFTAPFAKPPLDSISITSQQLYRLHHLA